MVRSTRGAGGGEYAVPALVRGMGILELLARHPEGLGVAEIAARLGVPGNSALRMAATLARMGYLHRAEATRRYVLTRKLLVLGYAAVHEHNIVERALEPLRRLREEVRETVALAALLPDEARGIVLAHLDSLHPFGFRLTDGMRFDLHCTGPGKALLAALPEAELRALLGRMTLARYTRNTITGRAALLRELEEARKTGYALDRGEALIGCHCVSSPVLDAHGRPVAAVWATGPSDRLAPRAFASVGARVRECAARIGERLELAT